jgi:hypothetical protein
MSTERDLYAVAASFETAFSVSELHAAFGRGSVFVVHRFCNKWLDESALILCEIQKRKGYRPTRKYRVCPAVPSHPPSGEVVRPLYSPPGWGGIQQKKPVS